MPIVVATVKAGPLLVSPTFANPKFDGGNASATIFVLYGNCTTPTESSASNVLESANRGDNDPCQFSAVPCIVQR